MNVYLFVKYVWCGVFKCRNNNLKNKRKVKINAEENITMNSKGKQFMVSSLGIEERGKKKSPRLVQQ
jgi:hypothetical protein